MTASGTLQATVTGLTTSDRFFVLFAAFDPADFPDLTEEEFDEFIEGQNELAAGWVAREWRVGEIMSHDPETLGPEARAALVAWISRKRMGSVLQIGPPGGTVD